MLLIVSICVFAYAAYQLVTIYFAYKTGVDEYKELNDFFTAEQAVPEQETTDKEPGAIKESQTEAEGASERGTGEGVLPEDDTQENTENGEILPVMENPVDFESLCGIIEDVIGWIKMESIPSISYPLVRGDDNDYYLHRTFQRTDNFAGSIFMDYLNNKDFSDRNSIIYGHNMKNGSMFGILKNYRDPAVYDESPYFWIYTPDYIFKYEIFSYSEVDKLSDAYQITFNTDEDFMEYLYKMKDYSERATDVELTDKDTVVTLSTCTGNDATRFIVQGKKVKTYKAIPKLDEDQTEER